MVLPAVPPVVGAGDGAAEARPTRTAPRRWHSRRATGSTTAVASVSSVSPRMLYENSGVPFDGWFCQPANLSVR